MTFRKRTSSCDIGCGYICFFLGLSTKSVAKKAQPFLNIKDIYQSGTDDGFKNTCFFFQTNFSQIFSYIYIYQIMHPKKWQ